MACRPILWIVSAGRGIHFLTPSTITERSALRAEVEKARLLGYAVDREGSALGVCCVAVPVCDADGHVIAAISACGETSQMSEEKQAEVIVALSAAAKAISQKLAPLPDPR